MAKIAPPRTRKIGVRRRRRQGWRWRRLTPAGAWARRPTILILHQRNLHGANEEDPTRDSSTSSSSSLLPSRAERLSNSDGTLAFPADIAGTFKGKRDAGARHGGDGTANGTTGARLPGMKASWARAAAAWWCFSYPPMGTARKTSSGCTARSRERRELHHRVGPSPAHGGRVLGAHGDAQSGESESHRPPVQKRAWV